MKILIVEDDAVTLKLLEAVLLREGHEVVAAVDGHQAWEIFDREPVRAIISDWMMPEMDGLELCRRVRARDKTAYTYFILLTSIDPNRENVRKAMMEGVDDFLKKPVDAEAIWARLQVAQRILNFTTEIRQLQEMLPICMYCKKIREDETYWTQIEQYMAARTGAGFSHGICPDCYNQVVLPQLDALSGGNPGRTD
jgi:phosphoserine phosphatase RsbU/P